MVNNQLCFCGSGKEQRECHAFIKDDSFGAKVFKIHKSIDNIVHEHYKNNSYETPCKKGCCECCYGYFFVPDFEFLVIAYHMQSWDSKRLKTLKMTAERQWAEFNYLLPEAANGLTKSRVSIEDIQQDLDYERSIAQLPFPCPFLDIGNKSCSIYELRPLICRGFGTSFMNMNNKESYQLCSKIPDAASATKWQADLSSLKDECTSLVYIQKDGLPTVCRRQYPLFYWVYTYFRIPLTKGEAFKQIFKMSEKDYIEVLYQNVKKL